MLNHLFATILICLGVANTTPISNYDHEESNQVLTTPKKQNITTNYELNLEIGPNNPAIYYPVQTPIDSNFTEPNILALKRNITGSNMALNVIGNWYESTMQVKNSNNNIVIAYPKAAEIYTNEKTQYGMMLKITPYNINVETTITLNIFLNVGSFTDNGIVYNTVVYGYSRRIYKSTDYDWNNYIDMQVAKNNSYTIESDITDINNGFYYEKEEEYINVQTNLNGVNIYNTIQNNIDLTITPNIDNYYFISYLPIVSSQVATSSGIYSYLAGQKWTLNDPLKITGTNIIPDGTYEVIDIPGLMYEVIGMPFAFVSQAFNLTLFPGTPYQINIANLFLSIAAIFVFVWLLLLFIKMKG